MHLPSLGIILSLLLYTIQAYNAHNPFAPHHLGLQKRQDACSTSTDCGSLNKCCYNVCIGPDQICCASGIYCYAADRCSTDDNGAICCCPVGRTCTGLCPPEDGTTSTTPTATGGTGVTTTPIVTNTGQTTAATAATALATCATACGAENKCCNGGCIGPDRICCKDGSNCYAGDVCHTDDNGAVCCCPAGRTCGLCSSSDSTSTTSSSTPSVASTSPATVTSSPASVTPVTSTSTTALRTSTAVVTVAATSQAGSASSSVAVHSIATAASSGGAAGTDIAHGGGFTSLIIGLGMIGLVLAGGMLVL